MQPTTITDATPSEVTIEVSPDETASNLITTPLHGDGEGLREGLSDKERTRRKKARKRASASRRRNRR